MTYLRTNKRPAQKRAQLLYFIGGVIIVVLVIIHLLLPHLLPSLFASVFRPFWTARFSIRAGSLDSRESLLLENESLKFLIDEYDTRLSTQKSLEQENLEIKSLLGRKKDMSSSTDYVSSSSTFIFSNKTLSAVLMRPPLSSYDELIIDIGMDYGVEINDKVYGPGSTLIGRVVDVLTHTSKVLLYSSPQEKYEVNIGSNNTIATAEGRGGGQYSAVVSRGASIKDGDFVTVPSIDNGPFGIVTAILSDPAEAFETVLFSSPVNIYSLKWVLVDTNTKNANQ
jgi:cell shape-determining protein MreC